MVVAMNYSSCKEKASILFLIVISLIAKCNSSNEVSVEFQADGIPSVDSYLLYKNMIPPITELTACFRFRKIQDRSFNSILTYAVPDFDNELSFGFSKSNFLVSCCHHSTPDISTEVNIEFMKWISTCFSLDLKNKKFLLVVDGKVTEKILNSSQNLQIEGGGILYLGQEQDAFNGSFNSEKSLRGKLADLNVFNYLLRMDLMTNFTTCLVIDVQVNALISFNNISKDFIVSKAEVRLGDKNEIPCNQPSKKSIILTDKLNFIKARKVCIALGGHLSEPLNRDENNALSALGAKYYDKCFYENSDYLWIAGTGHAKNQTFKHYLTGQMLSSYNLSVNEGITDDICTSLVASPNESPKHFGTWKLADCSSFKCTSCTFSGQKLLKLRGLCKSSYFDREYYLFEFNKTITFYGTEKSVMNRIPGDLSKPNDYGSWEIRIADKPDVKARMKVTSHELYPIGQHKWEIENDICGTASSDLVMTVCSSSNFTCSEGTCLDMNSRCDSGYVKEGCDDKSDDENCELLLLPFAYSVFVSPPKERTETPVNVSISVDVLSILPVNLENHEITTEILVRMTWYDARVKFRNLKRNTTFNHLSNFSSLLWTPKFEITSGKDYVSGDYTLRTYSLAVLLQDGPLPYDDQNIHEDTIYSGRNNPLRLVQRLTVKSKCVFYLMDFPSDVQHCNMIILLTEATTNFVTLVTEGDGISFKGQRRLREYYVDAVRIFDYEEDMFSGKKIEIIFMNLVTYHVTNTYFPTLIMLIISTLSFLFPLEAFEERLINSITSLLIEASLFTAGSFSITKTAYMKVIDVWYMFCTIVLFSVVLSVIILNYIYNLEKSQQLFIQVSPAPPTDKKPINYPKGHLIPKLRDWKKVANQVNFILGILCTVGIFVFVVIFGYISVLKISYI